jgi:hypothetical protein
MTRREALISSAGAALNPGLAVPADRAPVVNGAEHAWVTNDPRFPIDPKLATCPANLPKHDYSAEYLLSEMRTYAVDHVVISHVCYYGRNNEYASYCVRHFQASLPLLGFWSAIGSIPRRTRRTLHAWSG